MRSGVIQGSTANTVLNPYRANISWKDGSVGQNDAGFRHAEVKVFGSLYQQPSKPSADLTRSETECSWTP